MPNNKNITFDQLLSSMTKVKEELAKKAEKSHGTHVSYGTSTTTLSPGSTGIIGSSPSLARADHTHTIPAYPTSLKSPGTLTINYNDKSSQTYNGSVDITANITPEAIGAAEKSHGTHVQYSTTDPSAGGTASAGVSNTVSRGDHVHPVQTTITGNAGTATKLQTPRDITIGNTTKSFNGTANVSYSLAEIGAIPIAGSSSISGNLEFAQSNTDTRGIVGSIGGNDYWRVVGGATESNAGFLEIATADDGSEPIYVRQYNSGKFVTLKRTATLLDASGNTSFPGTVTAPSFTGNLNGIASNATNATTATNATQLTTARNINGVSFNGTQDITVPINTFKSTVAADNSKPYHRILSTGVIDTIYTDKSIVLMATGNYSSGPFGIVKIVVRTDNTGQNSSCGIKWIVREGFSANSIVANYRRTNGDTAVDIFYKCANTYASVTWVILSEGSRDSSGFNTTWIKRNTSASAGTEVYTETEMKALDTYDVTLQGGSDVTTVSSASKLSTARTINGTSFDGSNNITTANWGTSRTLTIGATGKSVNGSANVSWSLAEIGASPSNHTHNYAASTTAGGGATEVEVVEDNTNKIYLAGVLDFNTAKIRASTPYLAGGTITATTFKGSLDGNAYSATKLQTARKINGVPFDGTYDVMTPLYNFTSYITNDNSKAYHRILTSGVITGQWVDKSITLYGTQDYGGGGFCIVKIMLRTNGPNEESYVEIKWLMRENFSTDKIVVNLRKTPGNTLADVFYKSTNLYDSVNWVVLDEGNRENTNCNLWTHYNTSAPNNVEVYTEAQMKALNSYSYTLGKGTLYGEVHKSEVVQDSGDGRTLSFAYSKEGMNSTDWFAVWNGNELRAMNPGKVRETIWAADKEHSHDILWNGNHYFRLSHRDNNDYAGLDRSNNVDVVTWYGFGITNSCPGCPVPEWATAWSCNARTGDTSQRGRVYAPGANITDLKANYFEAYDSMSTPALWIGAYRLSIGGQPSNPGWGDIWIQL